MSFDIQGFNEVGNAVWSVGLQTWDEVLQYLGREELTEDRYTNVLLIRRGPQVLTEGSCETIGPYQLVPTAKCQLCREEEEKNHA